MSYLYLLHCEGFYKIGITKNPKKRMSELQVGNPFKINPIGFYKTKDAEGLECTIHNTFRFVNVSGEWFKIPDEYINTIVEFLKKIDNAN